MRSARNLLEAALEQHRAGELVLAEHLYRQVIDAEPNNAHAWHLLGALAGDQGDAALAIECLNKAIRLAPTEAIPYYNLGRVFQRQEKMQDAVSCYLQALKLKPDYVEACGNLGLSLEKLGQLEAAESWLRRGVDLNLERAEGYYKLGTFLRTHGRYDEAIACLRRTLDLDPSYADAQNNLGNCFLCQYRLDEALECFRKAIALDPNSIAHWNQAALLLLKGDFEHGWPEYEWRFPKGAVKLQEVPGERWNGQNVEGKTVLLLAEQGLGDTIQFVRYARLVQRLDARVILGCQQPLVKLLQGFCGVGHLLTEGQTPPAFDYYTPLLSLPRIFGTTLSSIPADTPYLFADPSLISMWQSRLASLSGFRIGVNWRGRTGLDQSTVRDIPLELMASLAEVPGIQLISLQKGPGEKDLKARGDLPIIDLGDFDTNHGAFMDTAAIMKNLDLVITSDTAVPHLAGALGVPVWIALPFLPEWRWLLNRSESPWYPSMRLFRQKAPGCWKGVFEEISTELESGLECLRG
jgi:tetratricopeptide (TPR) repeat protein